MQESFRRTYYEVDWKGIEASSDKDVSGVMEIPSEAIEKTFPFQHGPIMSAENQHEQRELVSKYFLANRPHNIARITDYRIERKDEFAGELNVTITYPKLIAKWASHQTFVLTPQQQDVFFFIENQLQNISLKWQEWKTLFGPPFENVELLNKTAPTSFSIMREALMHDIMMSIRRLFDRKGESQENMTFDWLRQTLDTGKQQKEFSDALDALQPKTKFLKTWRDKVLAHNDLHHGLAKELLPPVEIDRVDELIREMSKMANIIQMNLSTNRFGGYVRYDDIIVDKGARALINFLKRGVSEHERQLAKFRKQKDEPLA